MDLLFLLRRMSEVRGRPFEEICVGLVKHVGIDPCDILNLLPCISPGVSVADDKLKMRLYTAYGEYFAARWLVNQKPLNKDADPEVVDGVQEYRRMVCNSIIENTVRDFQLLEVLVRLDPRPRLIS